MIMNKEVILPFSLPQYEMQCPARGSPSGRLLEQSEEYWIDCRKGEGTLHFGPKMLER